MAHDVLDLFHPAVAAWFRESFAEPTPAQARGWPQIAAGKNTLILAPTGSGKTLAAFLHAIDELVSRAPDAVEQRGVHALYVSPAKALANDIERNLDPLLAGVRACAARMNVEAADVTVGIRTGDTTSSERQKMARRPPNLLITTPESLHLLLSSPRARDMLRTVREVIVDEIHAVAATKRGTFLALLLERLDALATPPPVRIGLSATQRPLERIGRFLGGYGADGAPRRVDVVDAGLRRDLDLRVESPVDDMTVLPSPDGIGPTIWPAIHERLLEAVEEHASTLIFANNRRLVERIAAEMNRLAGHSLVRAHHGSLSKAHRHEIERELKAGRLPALVATSSLELGIDVGAIDLVCQVEAPTSVASALQRVGRAGHVYRETSKGRMIPKTRDDLVRMAGVARAMRAGEISAVRPPENALDVLAQQIVAMVALDDWPVDALYARVRQAYPYHALPRAAFDGVLDLVSGRFRSPTVYALRPRVAWDRARGLLQALPGSRQAVVLNGGTIPDSGQYPMVLGDGKTKLGELDEEFVFERRLGQTILLGTSRWRLLEIGTDRVIVEPSEDLAAVMPFWKGDGLGHDAEFGRRLGELLRLCRERIDDPGFEPWLEGECALDPAAARNLAAYLRDQCGRGGGLPDDRTILVDAFRDERGDERVAILSPYGRAFHRALLLAVQGTLRSEGAEMRQAIFSNAGILCRPGSLGANGLVRALWSLAAEDVEERVTAELEHTPFFALRFRQNAARALLLPRARPGRRTPLWLQRLRAHDLLGYASDHPDLPIVAETYREILEDLLPIDALRDLLERMATGDARFVVRRDPRPSPFAASLLFDFTAAFFYDEDQPAPSGDGRLGRDEMVALLRGKGDRLSFDAEAAAILDDRMQAVAEFNRARDGVELVDLLRRVGDLSEDELRERCAPAALDALPDLTADGRVVVAEVRGARPRRRFVGAEDAERYARWGDDDVRDVVRRYLAERAGSTREAVSERYAGGERAIDDLVRMGAIVEVSLSNGERRLIDPEVLVGLRRLSLARRRRRVCPASPAAFSASVVRRLGVGVGQVGEDAAGDALLQLAGVALPPEAWEDVLAARLERFGVERLDHLVRDGSAIWRGRSGGGVGSIAFAAPDVAWILGAPETTRPSVGSAARIVDHLDEAGASYLHQIAAALDVPPSEVAAALWTLIWDGWVTNDSVAPAWAGRPDLRLWRGRKRPSWGGGRWSVRSGIDRGESDDDVRTRLRILLDRYGVLSRELCEREPIGPRWRTAYPILSRMEWRGDVDRGLFVTGLSGPQFAAPGVADELAAAGGVADERFVLVNVLDPANVWGDVLPVRAPDGVRYAVRHHPGNHLVLRDGRPVLAVENRGERLIPLVDLGDDERRGAIGILAKLVGGRHRAAIRVRTWAGRPVTETPAAADLERLGFMREDRAMILYRSFGGEG